MTQAMIVTIMQDAIMTLLKCALPMMLTALVIGVIISIFQAATQISEQTLSFVPKIVGTFLALLVCLGYILSQLSGLVTRLYGYIGQMIYEHGDPPCAGFGRAGLRPAAVPPGLGPDAFLAHLRPGEHSAGRQDQL